jgi:hypothetical protein
MSQVPVQRRDADSTSSKVLLPVLAYAERYPSVPIFMIVECLLDTWRDASLTYVDDDWMGSFDRLATARLADLNEVESRSSAPRADRRDGYGRRAG